MKRTKVYLDTSIINFIYADDTPDLKQATIEFFEKTVKPMVFDIYISEVVIDEINNTQNDKKRSQLLGSVAEYKLEVLSINDEAERLASIYIKEKIIPASKLKDAQHIGISTVNEFDVLLSWNYKHLAN